MALSSGNHVAEEPNKAGASNKVYQDIPEDQRNKAQIFFARGKTVADTGQYDYSIEMFLQGLTIDPEAVEAHGTLRDISLKRKASGGKKLGMFENMKLLRSGKDEKVNMLNAEKALAYDPGNLGALDTMYQGNYTGSGSFRDSMRNKDEQQQLIESERDVRSASFMERRIREAEAQLAADPNEPGKMIKLVEALVITEQMENENR